MSKRTNTIFKKKAHLLQMNIPTIAYKVASSEIRNKILTPQSSSELCGYDFIGAQIEFKEKVITVNGTTEWNYIEHPILVQLYFNKAPADGVSYFKRVDTFNGNQFILTPVNVRIVVANQGDIVEVEGEDPIQEPNWFSLGNFTLPPNVDNRFLYKKLDFYKSTRLVYFASGPLQSLTHLYDNLIISGCQLNMGKKLAHNPPPSTNSEHEPKKTFKENYFSLKIEGESPNPDAFSTNNRLAIEVTDATGADITIGHPCPPRWETFLALLGNIVNHYPNQAAALLSRTWDIWDDWNTNVYYVVGGPVEAITVFHE